MKSSTFIQVPSDVTNPVELSRFLHRLVEILDTAYGNRGDTPLANLSDVITQATTLAGLKQDINNLDSRYIRLDGSTKPIQPIEYASNVQLDNDRVLVSMAMVKAQTIQPHISKLTSTDSNDIKDKINEIIQLLNTTQLIKT